MLEYAITGSCKHALKLSNGFNLDYT